MQNCQIRKGSSVGSQAEFALGKAIKELTAAKTQIEDLQLRIRRLETMPMKYRRMDFNARLQEENERLNTKLTAEREVSDKLEKALKAVRWQVKKDSDADVIAEASLAEVAATRKGEEG